MKYGWCQFTCSTFTWRLKPRVWGRTLHGMHGSKTCILCQMASYNIVSSFPAPSPHTGKKGLAHFKPFPGFADSACHMTNQALLSLGLAELGHDLPMYFSLRFLNWCGQSSTTPLAFYHYIVHPSLPTLKSIAYQTKETQNIHCLLASSMICAWMCPHTTA